MTDIVGYAEASKILGGVPVNTLKDWRAKGRGPRSAVIAGRVKYRVSDLCAWLDAQFEPAEVTFTPLGRRKKGTR